MTPIRNNCATDRPGSPVERLDASAIVDAAGTDWSPGSVLVERRGRQALVLAVGPPGEVDRHPAAVAARRFNLSDSVVIPGLVNAHTHLDLTHLGPRKYLLEDGFVPWVDMVRTGRHDDAEAIASSVRQGIALSLAGGTVAVGDIAGAPKGRPTLAPFRELAASALMGVSFVEFFGIGPRTDLTRDRLESLLAECPRRATDQVRLGLQPHAPNTVGLPLYEWAAALASSQGAPLATHLAETVEERQFIGAGTGPQREMLERLGVWDDAVLEHIGRGRHPVAHLARVLESARFTVAHVNDADDAAIEILARTGTIVAYCPRASSYFGVEKHFGPHRYADMLAAGVTVALGTDSIVNLPDSAARESTGGVSVLDEMRLLHTRDQANPKTLLRMATLNGAAALGLDPAMFMIQPGNTLAGLVAVPIGAGRGSPLEQALRSDGPATLLFPKN